MSQERLQSPMSEGEMAGDLPDAFNVPDDYDEDSDSDLGSLMDDLSIMGQDENSEKHTESPDMTRGDQIQMIHLRRFLDQLSERVVEKDYVVQKTREELKKCTGRIEQLGQERDEVFNEINNQENAGNTAAVSRLRAQHERLCKELQNEEQLEIKIKDALDEAEYNLAQMQVEQGKYILMEHELGQREEKWERERTELADKRHKKEIRMAAQAGHRLRENNKQQIEAEEERQMRQKYLIEGAKSSQEKHNKFLKQTITKLREREQEVQKQEKEHIQQRMKTMVALKGDIAANRENLRALQARDKAFAANEKHLEGQRRSAIISAGGNPSEELLKQRRIQDLDKEKQQFSAQQRERQIQIAARILQEEEQMKKRMQQQPQLWTDPKKKKVPTATLR